jgi:hypothetical protein
MAVPNAPTTLISSYTIPNVIDLSWTAPVGGDVATGYVLYSGSEEGIYTGTFLIEGVEVVTYQFTGTENVDIGALGDGETVWFKIHAVNGDGESVGFDSNSGTTMDVPTICTDVEVVIGTTSLIFSWTDPVFDGGSEILLYNVYTGTTLGTIVLTGTVASTANDYSITGLAGGVTRFFKVSAVNAIGEGPITEPISGRTLVVPGVPTALTDVDGNTVVSLSWVAPTEHGEPALTHYNIYRGVETGVLVLIGTSATTTYSSTGLVNGTTYFYTVAAVNTTGVGTQTAEITATPEAAGVNQVSNRNLVACGAINVSVFELTNGHSWTLDVPASKTVMGITANFTSSASFVGTLSLVTNLANKTVKVYNGNTESADLFDVVAVVYYK